MIEGNRLWTTEVYGGRRVFLSLDRSRENGPAGSVPNQPSACRSSRDVLTTLSGARAEMIRIRRELRAEIGNNQDCWRMFREIKPLMDE